MIKLDPPEISTERVFRDCAPGITDTDRRDRVQLLLPTAAAVAAQFLSEARHARHHLLPVTRASTTQRSDMVWFYEKRLVESLPGKVIYDQIARTTEGRCALCGIARAKTLDHTLPKSVHPFLAVTPANLVPACRDCNIEKNALTRGSVSPYFDRWLSDQKWLSATAPDKEAPQVLAFSVRPPEGWTADQISIAEAFAEQCDLSERYALNAADELVGARDVLRLLRDAGGTAVLASTLAESSAAAAALGPNHWKAAAYRYWAESAPTVAAWL